MFTYGGKKFLKFIVGSFLNSCITYVVYIFFYQRFNYSFAYTISFVIGTIFAYLYNSKVVFNQEKTKIFLFAQYSLIPLLIFFLNLLILYCLIEFILISKNFAPIIVIAISWPVNYILNKKIFNKSI